MLLVFSIVLGRGCKTPGKEEGVCEALLDTWPEARCSGTCVAVPIDRRSGVRRATEKKNGRAERPDQARPETFSCRGREEMHAVVHVATDNHHVAGNCPTMLEIPDLFFLRVVCVHLRYIEKSRSPAEECVFPRAYTEPDRADQAIGR